MRQLIYKTLAIGIISSLSMMSYSQEEGTAPPPALVEVSPAISEQIAQQIWVPGTVLSRTDSNIAAEVAGRITWMADVGDLVEAGDVLAKVDDHILQLSFEQNVSNIAKWEARVELLEQKQARFSSMVQQANTSKDQLDEIISELEIARQELNQAKVDKRLTAYKIAQSHVKAPFKALVADRLQSPGEYISIGQNVLRIVDTANIEASIKAPLSSVPFIQQGMQVIVKQGNLETKQAIRAIVPVGNARSRMMEVRVSLLPDQYAIGGAVRVALPHSLAHEGITVPRDALVLRKSGAFVYQINDSDEAKQIQVTTGIGIGDRIEVFGDLSHLDPVVVRGAERLKEGQKVRYSDEPQDQVATL